MKDFIIYGINPLTEALRSGACRIREVWVAEGGDKKRLVEIIAQAQSQRINIRKVRRSLLDSLAPNTPHQGVACIADPITYAKLEQILEQKKGTPLVLVLDGIEDPRNLGALVRTAAACGVWGVVIPKDRAAGITPVVAKASAGAIFYIPIVRVANIPATLRRIKEKGIWVVGADADATTDIYQQDLTIPLAVVIGGEDQGLRPLVRRHCDLILSIPMSPLVNSLNASVAGAIILYEAMRQRKQLQ